VPDATFQIAASEAAAAVILVFDIEEDFAAVGLDAGVDDIGIVDNQAVAAGFSASNLVRLLHQASARIVFGESGDHDHSATQS
jgi:hypothetical protein